ncbi:MAG: transcriptional regulator [Pseudomonadota bacterium]
MKKKTRTDNRVLLELLETANDFSAYGLVSKDDMVKMRALCGVPPDYPPERVAFIRKSIAKMSQSVFATLLNVSVSSVQKWESPTADKRPNGAAAKLLHILETKGVEAILI